MKLVFGAAVSAAAVLHGQLAFADVYGDPNAPMTITWVTQPTQSPEAGNERYASYYKGKIEAFVAAHPEVKVDVTLNSNNGNAGMTKLLEQLAIGQGPDFATIDSFFVKRFLPYLTPMNDYYTEEEVNDFFPFAREAMVVDGKLKAFWVNTDVRNIYYRKDLVATPPKTWDELLEVAGKLSEEGHTGYIFPAGRGEAAVMEHLPMFWAQGGELIDEDGKPVFGEGANRDAWINVLTFMRKAVESGASPNRVANFGSESDMQPELARGNTAIFLGGCWMMSELKSLGDQNDWGVADIPLMTEGKPITAVGGWMTGVFTDNADKLPFIAELQKMLQTSPEAMDELAVVRDDLPTRASVVKMGSPYFQDPLNIAYMEMLEFGRPRPSSVIYPTISVELQVAISDVVTGAKSPADALDAAFDKVMAQYKP